ncbi:hypothetical protein, partial [Streptomyces sp. uw30]|uniref:hypothetical protein n=1 Tax=Streptomyces sp. uw30 TaxID=1828179 RepID=UPI0039677E96
MTSWLGVVRGRTRAAASGPRASSWPAGTLTVVVTGLAVGLWGAGVSYGLDDPHGAAPSGSSSGSAGVGWSSGFPWEAGGAPTAASGTSPPSAAAEGEDMGEGRGEAEGEPSSGPPGQDEKPSGSTASPAETSGESGESGESADSGESGEQSSQEPSDERSETAVKRPRTSATPTAHGPAASSPDPSDKPSRAGSRAGEGRERPGREKGPLEDEEAARDRPDGGERADEGHGSGRPEAEDEGEGDDDGGGVPESSDAADAATQDPVPSIPPNRPALHP